MRALLPLGARLGKGGVWTGWEGAPEVDGATVDVGAAGTSLRLLLPVLAAGRVDLLITGTPELLARPIDPLIDLLNELGAHVAREGETGIRIQSSGLRGGDWIAPTRESSQFLSGLLMAAPLVGEPVFVHAPLGAVPSAGYVELTLAILRSFTGQELPWGPEGIAVEPTALQAQDARIPGDASGAAFFLAALALVGGQLEIGPSWATAHPDALLPRRMVEAGWLRVAESATPSLLALEGAEVPTHGGDWLLDEAPDLGPILAVMLAACPEGGRLLEVARLRHKESDRVRGIRELLACIGQMAVPDRGDLQIPGGGLQLVQGATFDPLGDHRLAMAAGVARLLVPGLIIQDTACVSKSFPDFWTHLKIATGALE